MRTNKVYAPLWAWAALAALGLMLNAGPRGHAGEPPGSRKPSAEDAKAAREAAWKKADAHLSAAHDKMAAAARRQDKEVNALFDGAKRRARGLAEELLSLDGKWAYLSKPDADYRQYLKKKYEEQVLKPEALSKVLEETTQRFLRELQAIENELLVALRADLDDLPNNSLPSQANEAAFRKHFQETAREVERLLSKNLKETVAKELTSFVMGEVAAQIAIRVGTAAAARLGISAAILGTGAYSGVATFGVSLAAGVVVDYLLDFLLRQLGYDPEGDIAAWVWLGLEDMRIALVEPSEAALAVTRALSAGVKDDSDPDVRMACHAARQQIARDGQLGLVFTLYAAGYDRFEVWKVTVQKLIFGESAFGDALAKAQANLATGRPPRTTEEALAKADRIMLPLGEELANSHSILRVLKSRNPNHRIDAVRAAVLVFGRVP